MQTTTWQTTRTQTTHTALGADRRSDRAGSPHRKACVPGRALRADQPGADGSGGAAGPHRYQVRHVHRAAAPGAGSAASMITGCWRWTGKRLNHYRTLYFDTPDFELYLLHVNGRADRYKVRSREYTDTHLSYLEVKHRTPKDRTIKERLSTARAGDLDDPGGRRLAGQACSPTTAGRWSRSCGTPSPA